MTEISIEQAMMKLPPVKPTSLDRMRDAAFAEVSRIESGQLSRLVSGSLADPMKEQMQKRDDFFGLVQLVDLILSDQVILDRIKERRKAQKAALAPALAPIAPGDEEIAPT